MRIQGHVTGRPPAQDEPVITFDFWREEHLLEHPEHAGRVLAAELRTGDFIGILDELAEVVGPDQGLTPPIRAAAAIGRTVSPRFAC
ncbi:hypothetical protein ACWEQG_31205 [Microbispora sp. NPDC004025]